MSIQDQPEQGQNMTNLKAYDLLGLDSFAMFPAWNCVPAWRQTSSEVITQILYIFVRMPQIKHVLNSTTTQQQVIGFHVQSGDQAKENTTVHIELAADSSGPL